MPSYQNLFQNYLVATKKNTSAKGLHNRSICVGTQKQPSFVQSNCHVNSTVHNTSIKVDCYAGNNTKHTQAHIHRNAPNQAINHQTTTNQKPITQTIRKCFTQKHSKEPKSSRVQCCHPKVINSQSN